MQVNNTHTVNILTQLLEGKTLCSSDVFASNSNQYFIKLKNNNIELVEEWEQNINNKGRHKERSLKQTRENIKRANEYLNSLLGKKSSEAKRRN